MKKWLWSLLLLPMFAMATDTSEDCAKLADKEKRLACYDSVSKMGNVKADELSEWSYSQDKDEMRGKVIYKAVNESENESSFGLLLGSSNLVLTLRKDPKYGNDILFSIENGVLSECMLGCNTAIKFDDQKIEHYSMKINDNTLLDTVSIKNKKDQQRFMKQIRKAKKMTVELSLFDHGKEQFTFDVHNLEWKHF